MGLLDGKVALITGAGGGLGRCHALQFAREGARVVVNDLGSTLDGSGESHNLADEVVAEIEELGGEAVADYGSVSDEDEARAMVDRALEEFGQLDIVVNNAGILRDKTLAKMTREMWDEVIDVHLTGTFLVTRAAFRAMSDQGRGGRIINTTSLAGLKGNFGQTNYSAAKAGIAGITRTVALEGRRDGITVNAIAPVAKTRMTEDIEAVPDELEAEDVSPLVTWLASDEADEVTGRIFGAHGSHYFEYKMEQTPGVDLGDERWTPAKVGERMVDIEEMPEPEDGGASDEQTEQVEALFRAMPSTLRAEAASSWTTSIQFEVEGTGHYVIDVDEGTATFETGQADDPGGKVTFDSAESLLAMAAGELKPEQAFMSGKIASDNMDLLMKFGKLFDLEEAAGAIEGAAGAGPADQPDGDGLNREMIGEKYKRSARFIKEPEIVAYAEATENDNPRHLDTDREGGIIAPPLFAQKLLHEVLSEVITDERLNADLLRLVHGEQDMRFHRPLRPWDLVAARAEIVSITDKSSGQLLEIDQWLVCEGEIVTEATSGIFIRAADGGSSSKKSTSDASKEPPQRDIVFEASQHVAEDQPMRYAEASGDHNPIHTDPQVAESAGLPGVILHGMCTMAFAGNAIVDELLAGDAARLSRLKVRFATPVFPEQTITTRVWKAGRAGDGQSQYGFEAVNDEETIVLSNGVAEIEQ